MVIKFLGKAGALCNTPVTLHPLFHQHFTLKKNILTHVEQKRSSCSNLYVMVL